MQILSTNVSSMPTSERILAVYNIALMDASSYKTLRMASFIALVLVKTNQLVELCREHIIKSRTPLDRIEFRSNLK